MRSRLSHLRLVQGLTKVLRKLIRLRGRIRSPAVYREIASIHSQRLVRIRPDGDDVRLVDEAERQLLGHVFSAGCHWAMEPGVLRGDFNRLCSNVENIACGIERGLHGLECDDNFEVGATSRNGSYKALREASVGMYKQLDGLLTRTAVAS